MRALGMGRAAGRARELVLITDPGPDPDDVKAILIAGTLHKRGDIVLRLVVTNGGQQARNRARLARCLLDALGVRAVPVAVGSAGRPYTPVAHEYALAGYDAVDEATLDPDAHASLLGVLRSARERALTVVCISSLRDLADVAAAEPALLLSKAERVVVQAGLEYDEGAARWRPDTSMNNEFDRDAAAAVYDFCFGRGLPLTVVSRHAVPQLPMQLARSFAERTASPVMAYLANAQFLGLAGLWQKLCAGELPARCTKQWYFETFCGVRAKQFASKGLQQLGADADIVPHLNGYVKPYDVCALMTVLPGKPGAAYAACPVADPRTPASPPSGAATRSPPQQAAPAPPAAQPAAAHRLHLTAEHAIGVEHVVQLLRNVYHDVVLATAPEPKLNPHLARALPTDRRELRANSLEGPPRLDAPSWRGRLRRGGGGGGGGGEGGAADAVLSAAEIIELFHLSLARTSARLQHVTRVASAGGVALFLLSVAVVFLAFDTPPPPGAGREQLATRELVGQAAFNLADLSIALGVLALQPIDSHRAATRATTVAIVAATVLYAVPGIPQTVEALGSDPPGGYGLSEVRGCSEDISRGWRVAMGVRQGQSILVYFGFDLWLVLVWLRTRRQPAGMAQVVRVRALWTACMLNLALQACPRAPLRIARCFDAQARGEGNPPWFLPWLVPMYALALALNCLMLAPGGRLRVQGLLARSACAGRGALARPRAHAEAALAPLIGYGSLTALEPSRVVPEALRNLRAASLGPDALRYARLSGGGGGGGGGRADSGGGGGGGWPDSGGGGGSSRHGSEVSRGSDGGSEAPLTPGSCARRSPSSLSSRLGGRLSLSLRTTGAAVRSATASLRPPRAAFNAPTTLVDLRQDRALRPEVLDAFVLHSDIDAEAERRSALRRWARTFHARHGRYPAVWLDALCADPVLDRREALAHEVVAMCRARTLLCLVGTSFVARLACIGRLLAWRATGGSLEDVEVLVVGRSEAEYRAVVAAVDAFHVVYAEHNRPDAPAAGGGSAGAARGGRGGARARISGARDDQGPLVHSIELAGPPSVNELVRSLLPPVQRAADEAIAALAAAGGGMISAGDDSSAESAGAAGRASVLDAVAPARAGGVAGGQDKLRARV